MPNVPPREVEDDTRRVVAYNTDYMSDRDRMEFQAEASKLSDIPAFNGQVKHAYAMTYAADPGCCPRCSSQTERKYANFVYLTQLALRVMTAPAGCFCTRCASVIVDEGLIKNGITDPRFRYKRVIGINYGPSKEDDYFQTWNGEDLVYVFDEDQKLLDVVPRRDLGSSVRHSTPNLPPRAASKKNKRKREKLAARSRRNNRKK